MRILCVDDDPVARVIYTRGLGEALSNDVVTEAASGEAAVDEIAECKVDVIITDLEMPGLNGLDVLAAAKEKDPLTEVIVVTGKASVATSVEAMRLGARDFIEKPIDISLLCEKVENIRDYHRRGREAEEFRTAKEVCEEQAGKEMRLLEIRLHKAEAAVGEALGVLQGTAPEIDQAIQILKRAS